MKAKLGLIVSPPANLRTTLVLVDADIRVSCFVADVDTGSDASASADGNDGVGGDVLKPDGFVVDAVNNLLGVVSA